MKNVVEYHSCIAVIGAENEICVLRSNSGRGYSFHFGTISILQSLSSQEQHCNYTITISMVNVQNSVISSIFLSDLYGVKSALFFPSNSKCEKEVPFYVFSRTTTFFLEHSFRVASLNSRILTSSEISIVIYLMKILTSYHLLFIHVTHLIYHFDCTLLPLVNIEPCNW